MPWHVLQYSRSPRISSRSYLDEEVFVEDSCHQKVQHHYIVLPDLTSSMAKVLTAGSRCGEEWKKFANTWLERSATGSWNDDWDHKQGHGNI